MLNPNGHVKIQCCVDRTDKVEDSVDNLLLLIVKVKECIIYFYYYFFFVSARQIQTCFMQ
jgi:hypothetical protein